LTVSWWEKIPHSEEHHVSRRRARRWHGAPAGGLRARRLRKTAQGIMTTDFYDDDPWRVVEGYTCPILGYYE